MVAGIYIHSVPPTWQPASILTFGQLVWSSTFANGEVHDMNPIQRLQFTYPSHNVRRTSCNVTITPLVVYQQIFEIFHTCLETPNP